MSGYTHLTQEERYQIWALKAAGYLQKEMAEILDRDPSTISRELRRNRGGRGYRPRQAHQKAMARRRDHVQGRIGEEVWRLVEVLLQRDWSPEQISGRLALERGLRISHEWIYQYIYSDKAAGGDLHTHLRCRKKRRKRYGTNDRRGKIAGQTRIDERPSVVDARQRIGDWEGDTIIGARHRGAVITMVERKSAFTVIVPTRRKTASGVRARLTQRMHPLRDRVLTMTVDNGLEWADHRGIATDLKTRVYFTHPYSSWERGLNENTNGLIRQYFPKTMDLTTVTTTDAERVMRRLNHRPRKSLDYRTPHEVFYQSSTELTVAPGS